MRSILSFPQWLDVDWYRTNHIDTESDLVNDWLFDAGSLTEKLEMHCNTLSLNKIGQDNIKIPEYDKVWLDNPVGTEYQVRDVLLVADNTPWVFAHSIIPDVVFETALANLGNTPLGKVLFSSSQFVRSGFEVGQVPANMLFDNQSTSKQPKLWARRSRFHYENLNLSVAEVFLPEAPIYG